MTYYSLQERDPPWWALECGWALILKIMLPHFAHGLTYKKLSGAALLKSSKPVDTVLQ
jgi:hypothetical protein